MFIIPKIEGLKLKIVILIFVVFFEVSVGFAATYKWEDANGVHFTDNVYSVPKKYRDKAIAEVREDISPLRSQGSSGPSLNSATVPQTTLHKYPDRGNTSLYGSGTMPQPSQAYLKPIRVKEQNTASFDKAFEAVTKTLIIVVIIVLFLFISWLLTLVDIIRSEFTNPSNKIVWLLLLVFMAPLGILLYSMLGSGQKVKRVIEGNEEFQTRRMDHLPPIKSRDGNFTID